MKIISTRSLLGLATGAVVVATSSMPMAAATADAAAAPTQSVTVFLKAPKPAALAALARNHTLTHAQRIVAVKKLVPSAAQHEQAATALRDEGFVVTAESSWSVTASATATTVAGTFGTRPKLATKPSTAQRAAATGALPDLPSSLSSIATSVFPTTGGPAVFSHIKDDGPAAKPVPRSQVAPRDALNDDLTNAGYDFQDAYATPSLTNAGGEPADGSYRLQRLTIATIQFAGWNSGDLSSYAAAAGLPYTSSTLTQVPVDQASVPAADDSGDDTEVDLDQESLLSTDPYAHQRAYFAPNTDAGFADAYSQVFDDVTDSSDAYDGGDTHIGALSVSWGECEDQNTPGAITDTFEPIIESLVAAGVTVFASSGDQGAYDCANYDADGDPVSATPGVDYPASSPEVVGVGGTSLTSNTAAINNGKNWAETAWSCTSAKSCTGPEATGGSGGGVSDTFPEPSYQSSTLPSTQNARGGRLVPDIAVDADPDTGFVVDTSDPTLLSEYDNVPYYQFGGTSLASPVSAALFTDMLSDHGAGNGIGDIHSDLYDAGSSAVRDITSGENGPAALDRASTGYDTVTGLGAPYWGAIGDEIFDKAEPTGEVTTSLPHTHASKSTTTVEVAWAGRPAASQGTTAEATLKQADVTVTRVGSLFPSIYDGAVTPAGSFTFTGAAGATYLAAVTVTDGYGDQSKTVSKRITVPINDNSFAFSAKGWERHSSTAAVGGSYVQSVRKTATAQVSATGDSYSITFRVGPTLGSASIAVSGRHAATVNLHARKSGFKTVHVWGGSSDSVAKRTVKVSLSGSKPIGIDALYADR